MFVRLVRKFSPAEVTMTSFNVLTITFLMFYFSSFMVLNVESVKILLIKCPWRKTLLVFRALSKIRGHLQCDKLQFAGISPLLSDFFWV